ncbi:hypothetical protein ILUMI_13056 [Ignelater luminosus]|uniref:Gustatory receptor n=1 Tax=Ignelater luminosus TaxID=2038154 RepID=A0A8K0CYG8_IGNLU|nr:hypothetical protein ILUMI_13056 [Ignelater luminosus]
MEDEERRFVQFYLQILKPLNFLLRLLALTPYRNSDEVITTLSEGGRTQDKIQMFVTYWLFFYEVIVFMQIEVKIELIKQMYVHMNQLLIDNSLEFNPKADECINIREYLGQFEKSKFNVYEIAKTHYIIGETITLINKAHGVQILAIVCSLILAMLILLNDTIIVVQSKSKEISTFTYISVMVQVLWCLCFLIIGIVIASHCSSTLRYANDTKVISQKLLLQDRPLLKGNDYDNRIFRYQLHLLYSSGDIPVFSAAGFFTVDFTMIYEVMGAVTTYFIVLLQFAGVTS